MNHERHEKPDSRCLSVSLITTYPPTRCGIGRFSHCLAEAITATAATTAVKVARIADTPDGSEDTTVEVTFDPASPVARRTAARHVNESDVVFLQHEYGIYGPEDGIAVLDLAHRIEAPLVSVLHTVRSSPSRRQREIIEALGRLGPLVVLSNVASLRLSAIHDVDPSLVYVIPHGSPWQPAPLSLGARRKLITWGLLGPGKGIERALHAVAKVKLEPPVTYQIVGQTHPNVLATHDHEYVMSLQHLTSQLDLTDQVTFVDRYVSDAELEPLAAAADLVVLPYDNSEQVSSGVLTDAVALGRPVVATAFPHAEEFAAQGCARAVAHDSTAMATAIFDMLTDDAAYRAARAASLRLSPSLSWPAVARAYLSLADRIRRRPVVA